MKQIIISVLILTLVIGAHQESNNDMKVACLDVAEVDESKLSQAREGIYVEDDQVAAYFYCIFLHMDFVTFNAEKINKETILEKLPISDKEKLKKTIDSCISSSKQRGDRKSHELYTCFVKELGAINNFA